MKTYKAIDDAIHEIAAQSIVRRRRKPTAGLVLFVAGVLLTVTAYLHIAGQDPFIERIAALSGIVIATAGFVKMIIDILSRGKLYYKPSGSELRRYELMFDTPYRMRVCQALMDGDFASLAGIPKGHSSAFRAVIYKTEDDNLLVAQAFESKRPLTEPRIFENGNFTFGLK